MTSTSAEPEASTGSTLDTPTKATPSIETSPTSSSIDTHPEEEEEDEYVTESLKAFIANADAALSNFLSVPETPAKGTNDLLPKTPHSDVLEKYETDLGVNPAYYVTAREAKANGAMPPTPDRPTPRSIPSSKHAMSTPLVVGTSVSKQVGNALNVPKDLIEKVTEEESPIVPKTLNEERDDTEVEDDAMDLLVQQASNLNLMSPTANGVPKDEHNNTAAEHVEEQPNHNNDNSTMPPSGIDTCELETSVEEETTPTTSNQTNKEPTTTDQMVFDDVESLIESQVEDEEEEEEEDHDDTSECQEAEEVDFTPNCEESGVDAKEPQNISDMLAANDDLSIGTQLSDDLSMDGSQDETGTKEDGDDDDDDESFFPNGDCIPSSPEPTPTKAPMGRNITTRKPTTTSTLPSTQTNRLSGSSKPKTRTFENSLSPRKRTALSKRTAPIPKLDTTTVPHKRNGSALRSNGSRSISLRKNVLSEEEVERQKRIEMLKRARKLQIPPKSPKARKLTTPQGPKLHTRAKRGERHYSIVGPQADKTSTAMVVSSAEVKPPPKVVRTRRLTIPVGPKLRTQEKNGDRRYSVVHDNKSSAGGDSKTNEVKKSQPSSPTRRVRSLTVPVAPKLQTQALHGDRRYSAVGKRAVGEKKAENQLVLPKKTKKRGLTIPVAPKLRSVSRTRSKPQGNKENISDNRSHTFKATPIGPGVLSNTRNTRTGGGVLGIPKVQKKTLTEPKPFRLSTTERSTLKAVSTKKNDDERSKSKSSFRARPLPNMSKKPTMITASKKRPTNTQPFRLLSEGRKGLDEKNQNLPLPPPPSPKRRTLTEPKPFNLSTNKRMPLPPSPPKRLPLSGLQQNTSKKRTLTEPKPFHFRSIQRSKDIASKNESRSSSDLPCPPKLTRKPVHKRTLTTPKPFRLRTSERHTHEMQTKKKDVSHSEPSRKSERRQSTVPIPFQLSSSRKAPVESSINLADENVLGRKTTTALPPAPPIMQSRSRDRELRMEQAKLLVSAAEELSLQPAASELSCPSFSTSLKSEVLCSTAVTSI